SKDPRGAEKDQSRLTASGEQAGNARHGVSVCWSERKPNQETLAMTDKDGTVLVTGATGRQGGSVVRHMLAQGWKLRGLARNPDQDAAKALAAQGVEVVRGDLEDSSSLPAAVRGVRGVYSVQDFWSVGARREVQQGKNLADAAKKAGVEHFVYSSVGGA